MKTSLLLAISVALLAPFALAETKPMPKTEPKAAVDPATAEKAQFEAAKKQASTLTADQSAKILDLVNKGDAKAIQEIKGIGAKRSASIIAKRPYSKVEDLSKVDDIGAKTFTDIITFAKGQQPVAPKKESKKPEAADKAMKN